MKKIFVLLILLFVFGMSAGSQNSCRIDDIINSCPISKTATVSVSVREVNSEKVIYSRDDKLLLHPASTLKAFSVPYILNKLGKDYKLTTSFYTSGNTLYIKLSGDPLLKTSDLNHVFKKLKAGKIGKINSVVIDDKIIDNTNWGVGWMWDDDKNPYMPKYSAYNINRNLSGKGVPVNDPKQNFIRILKYCLKNNGISFNGKVKSGNIPTACVLQYKIVRNLPEILKIINRKSDNLAAETLLKIASRNGNNSTGTTKRGVSELIDYYEQLGVKNSGQVIVDASGVSHNNLVQTNWMTSALAKVYKQPYGKLYSDTLSTPGNGTLRNRLTRLSGKLNAKTGTLSAISGIVGYIKTGSDKIYSFAILIQNHVDTSESKELEDKIIKEIIKL